MRTPTGTLKQSTAMERVLQSSYLYERSSQIHYVQEQHWANKVSLLREDTQQMNWCFGQFLHHTGKEIETSKTSLKMDVIMLYVI